MAFVVSVAPGDGTTAPTLATSASDARPPEVSIAAQFYNTKTGATTTSTKATKTQRRKHQINSLAISAAERELELLDKKGKSNKTKHETNARYGW